MRNELDLDRMDFHVFFKGDEFTVKTDEGLADFVLRWRLFRLFRQIGRVNLGFGELL